MIIKYLVFCITVLYRSEIISYAEKTDSVISDGDSRAKFTNLLNTIVKVSEERVQAMKKMATLEDYLLTKHGEKNDDYYDYDERKDSQKASTEDNENKSDSVSGGLSIEDSLSTCDTTEPPSFEREEEAKRDLYKISGDFRTNDSNIEPYKFNFNPGVVGDTFYNTTKIFKKTIRSKKENKHQGVTRRKHSRLHKITKVKDNSDFLVNNKVNRLNPLQNKNIRPLRDMSDEISTSNFRYLLNLTESNSKEYVKSDVISKYPKLNKPRNSRNFVILRNREIILSEDKNDKTINSEIPLQSKEIDIALERANQILKEQQDKIQNRKASHYIQLALTTSFDTTKTEIITELPNIKNVHENSKPHKDRFTLTILDFDENQSQFRAEDLSNIQGSTFLVKDETEKMSSMSKVIQNNGTVNLNLKLRTININEKEPYDQLDVTIGSGQKLKALGISSIAQTKDIPADKRNSNNIDFDSTVLYYKPDSKNNVNYNFIYSTVMETQSKIARNNFDAPSNMNDIQYKITKKKKKVDLSDDFSEAEMTLTDNNDSDETSGDRFTNVNDQLDHEYSESIKYIKKDRSTGNILRCSGTGMKCKKTLKKCRKACTEAYTSVCHRSKCSPKVERELKYQCQKSCDTTFGKRT